MLAAGVIMTAFLWRTTSACSPDPVVHVACIGDSITEGDTSGIEATYPTLLGEVVGSQYVVTNYGVGGRTAQSDTGDAYVDTDKYQSAVEAEADVYVAMLGTNDAKLRLWNENNYVLHLTSLLDGFAALSSKPTIVILSPPPYIMREQKWGPVETSPINIRMQSLVKQIATERGFFFVDVHARFLEEAVGQDLAVFYEQGDGIHPNQDGNRLIARAVALDLVKTPSPTASIMCLPTAPSSQLVATRVQAPTPAQIPTYVPTHRPTYSPSRMPTHEPTNTSINIPVSTPTQMRTPTPTLIPTRLPTHAPKHLPTHMPTRALSQVPTFIPTQLQTHLPAHAPTDLPTRITTRPPSQIPTRKPTPLPTRTPTHNLTFTPIQTSPQPPMPLSLLPPTHMPIQIPAVTTLINLPSAVAQSSLPTHMPSNVPIQVTSHPPMATQALSSLPTPMPSSVPTTLTSIFPTQAFRNKPSLAQWEASSMWPSLQQTGYSTKASSFSVDAPTLSASSTTGPTRLSLPHSSLLSRRAIMILNGIGAGEVGEAEIGEFEAVIDSVAGINWVIVEGVNRRRRRLDETYSASAELAFTFAGDAVQLQKAMVDGSLIGRIRASGTKLSRTRSVELILDEIPRESSDKSSQGIFQLDILIVLPVIGGGLVVVVAAALIMYLLGLPRTSASPCTIENVATISKQHSTLDDYHKPRPLSGRSSKHGDDESGSKVGTPFRLHNFDDDESEVNEVAESGGAV